MDTQFELMKIDNKIQNTKNCKLNHTVTSIKPIVLAGWTVYPVGDTNTCSLTKNNSV